MQLYDGRLVWQQTSDDGVIEVVDEGDIRSLHFGTFPKQSSMSRRRPHQLILSYTQAMMAALLLQPEPKRVLIIGLGGGSVVKFLLHHWPNCQIWVIEYRQDVIQTAQQYFSVPEDNDHLTVIHADGIDWVSAWFHEQHALFDMIFVDAYDHEGMSAGIGAQLFFDACAGVLTDSGVMSINLWGSDRNGFTQTMQRINLSFKDQSVLLPVPDKGNVIALASHAPLDRKQLKQRQSLAIELEQALTLPMTAFLQRINRHNGSLLSRLFI
ncbi:Spermidine synthase-like protein [Methylophaga frappieri]|uniref:Spermidine synthase-like protein n=1 Tax=Methylophaga frappieri (strain ATCC BAA-2434 / DSM 25690 / JAM7) TaxID=754477 RepID=I1YEP6_METFJ|nr:spermidine synthase [Methylophaga frappieri]AFJ01389.1 Spermidine synthase-like protein [Methylophaga frappieri]